ncbi:hypothetical protein [Streptomyces xinghaiensis]|uniref:hypothetical protein n=1 Tax=Streptomyces xinghaiensis TaxID=1038928 RepID=UPI003419D125
MSSRKYFGRLAALGAIVVTALGSGLAPQAVAAETCTSTTGARVCFESYGDHFFVYDTREDGHRAGVQYTYPGAGGYYFCDNAGGASGTPKDCNRNLPENVTVEFRALVCEGDCKTALGESRNLIRASGWAWASTG